MLTTALLVSILVEVANVLLIIQDNQVKIDLLLPISKEPSIDNEHMGHGIISDKPVLRLEAVSAAVLVLGVVDDHGCDGAALVLVGPHCEVLAVSEHAVDRMPPGEHRGRLAPALDLPERGPPAPDGLGAGLALVNGRGN